MSRAFKNIDYNQKVVAKIVEDEFVGYYLIVSPLGSENSIEDYLLDSLEEAIEEALERAPGLAKDNWYHVEPVEGEVSLHEATVCSITTENDLCFITLEAGWVNREDADLCVQLTGIKSIEVDGNIEQSIEMICPDGEIILADVSESEIRLIIEWNDFETRDFTTISYRVTCETVSLHRKLNIKYVS